MQHECGGTSWRQSDPAFIRFNFSEHPHDHFFHRPRCTAMEEPILMRSLGANTHAVMVVPAPISFRLTATCHSISGLSSSPLERKKIARCSFTASAGVRGIGSPFRLARCAKHSTAWSTLDKRFGAALDGN
jgi:hypothetical protein